VESAQRKFDQRIEEAQAENLKAIREAQEQLRLLEADYVAATRRKEEAHRRVIEAEAKLREATTPRLLSTFIETRANSSDYRKHLGILALVRNDFEKLSKLMSEQNDALDGVLKNGEDPLPKYEDEVEGENNRINRIVLYIDDLDRCPPAKVVEVLQAVHLLLAFPLFVVVVGVDARWVVRSLEARYRELLKSDGKPADQEKIDEFRELFGNASAHDYVEKIFQVPFWLKRMTLGATRDLVQDLLKNSLEAEGEQQEGRDNTSDRDLGTEKTGTGSAAPGNEPKQTPAANKGEQHAKGAAGNTADQKQGGKKEKAEAKQAQSEDVPDLSPEGLKISRVELDFISELAPLLGRSPRALKRFVNVYRLIRVRLGSWDRRLFLSKAHSVPDYGAVLFLLAIDTGAPQVAPAFFKRLRESSMNGQSAVTLKKLIGELDDDESTNGLEEWGQLKTWVLSQQVLSNTPDAVSRLSYWLERVTPFSFHSGRF
jgi:hypothetical protein